MPWAIAGAGIAAAGALGSAEIGAGASKSAAGAQTTAANTASQLEQRRFDQTTSMAQPYVDAGGNALSQLQKLLNIGPGATGGGASSPILQMLGIGTPGGAGTIDPRTFQGSPGYQYALQQGTNAVTNATAFNPGGNALRALQGVGQQTANQNFNQYLGNASGAWNNLIQDVSGVAGNGQNAAFKLGAMGQDVASGIGGNTIGAGNAGAAGIMGGANATGGGMNSAIQALLTAMQNPQAQGGLKRLFGDGSAPSYSTLDPTGQSVGAYPGQGQPDSFFLPGGGGYAG